MRHPRDPVERAAESDGTAVQADGDHAGVHFPPPLIHAAAIGVGVGLSMFAPLQFPDSRLGLAVGIGLLSAALFIALAAFRQFAIHRNPLPPNRPIGPLMTGGPFRCSRNPLYLALALVHCGVGLVSGNGWVLLLLPPALLVVRFYVIAREESYLMRRFGSRYLAYRTAVRRWF